MRRKEGGDYFGKRGYSLIGRHVGVYGNLVYSWAQSLPERSLRVPEGRIRRVDIIYNEFKSIAQQRIVVEQFIPVPPLPRSRLCGRTSELHL